jgi:hypothetical protein
MCAEANLAVAPLRGTLGFESRKAPLLLAALNAFRDSGYAMG